MGERVRPSPPNCQAVINAYDWSKRLNLFYQSENILCEKREGTNMDTLFGGAIVREAGYLLPP